MSFKRKIAQEPQIKEHFFDGAGHIELRPILNGPEEMYHKGRVCSMLTLQPGCEVGRHRHNGDGETYYILLGTGEYLLDGEYVPVEAGNVMFVDDGEEHGLRNTGSEPMLVFALVLYK